MSGIRCLGKKCFEFGVMRLPNRKKPCLYLYYAGENRAHEVLGYFTSEKNAKRFERAINLLSEVREMK